MPFLVKATLCNVSETANINYETVQLTFSIDAMWKGQSKEWVPVSSGVFVHKRVHSVKYYVERRYRLQVFSTKEPAVYPLEMPPDELLPRVKVPSVRQLARYLVAWHDYETNTRIPFVTGQQALFFLRHFPKGFSLSRHYYDGTVDKYVPNFAIKFNDNHASDLY